MFKKKKKLNRKDFVPYSKYTARQCYNMAVYYVEKEYSIKQIAKIYRNNTTAIYGALKKNNIDLSRTKSKNALSKTNPLNDTYKEKALEILKENKATSFLVAFEKDKKPSFYEIYLSREGKLEDVKHQSYIG